MVCQHGRAGARETGEESGFPGTERMKMGHDSDGGDENAAVDTIAKKLHLADESAGRPSAEEAERAVRTLIAWCGDDPDREGLVDTPRRVAAAYRELFAGYMQDPAEFLGRTFEEIGGYDDMILLRDISFYSHCEHHMLPFVGKVHIAYYPRQGVVGLSKLARVVEMYAKRLQTQENMTAQIAGAIDEGLRSRGVAVLVEATHQCMAMRGIKKEGVSTTTTRFTGVFRTDAEERRRFMSMVGAAAS